MATIGERIREKRKAKGMTLQQLGDVFGISRSSVAGWESGDTKPSQEKLLELAKALDTSVDFLLQDKDQNTLLIGELKSYDSAKVSERNVAEPTRDVQKLPVISWVQAGHWAEIVDNFQPGDAEEWVQCPFKNSDSAFVLRVVGESMFNPGGEVSFRDGDYISVDPQREALHRSLVIAKRTDDQSATFKQLLIENDGTIMLHALNPAWPNRYIPMDEHTQIVGVITGQWRAF
ncbi:LexA family protein [Caballeronia zhejiangensis]|uniref:LexA family protein n=1 Tax=Caballeronia zhejiangensis TaxID=871203 RepID=UPI00158B0828|nr:S24 family peptidase [Caballeronia zhejiangensis]